jgi:hypothetical protein
MIVNTNFLLWISSLGFVATSSLDRVYIRRGDALKKNQDSSPVTWWCQPSRWTACRNGNIALACSFHFTLNHRSTSAALNANGTIWSQLTHVNTPTLLYNQHAVFQLSNKPIWKEIYPISAKFCYQDHRAKVFECELRHGTLHDRIVPHQSRIELFKVCRHVHKTVSEVWL